MEEVIDAAKASNANNFISQLPQGYNTLVNVYFIVCNICKNIRKIHSKYVCMQVGERGVQMSGGQKQRIAIARAIIKSPKILLLDEATSVLDSKSKWLVQEALNVASAGCTTIMIAHHFSTIQNSDLIAVVQNGQVAEIGSYHTLIEDENGLYTSLIRLQPTEKNEFPYPGI